jgi:hypothetical protein
MALRSQRLGQKLWVRVWAVSLAGAFALTASAQPPSVRQQIHAAAPGARNQALGSFLEQHGQPCAVTESAFGGTLKTPRLTGDLWSVRCQGGSAFAVLIGTDAASTAWFLPCESVERMSSRRCFDTAQHTEILQ